MCTVTEAAEPIKGIGATPQWVNYFWILGCGWNELIGISDMASINDGNLSRDIIWKTFQFKYLF